ncbi:MAG: hypothetical protein ACREAA_15520 [Candidatus Polarisedimenticolia bacterium]
MRSVAVLAVLYAALFGGIALAMLQTPERFGMVMRYVPGVLVWGLLPAADMWLWARQGDLQTGDPAPDFTLPLQDGSGEVTLSSYRGRQPVVLVFGSYT